MIFCIILHKYQYSIDWSIVTSSKTFLNNFSIYGAKFQLSNSSSLLIYIANLLLYMFAKVHLNEIMVIEGGESAFREKKIIYNKPLH